MNQIILPTKAIGETITYTITFSDRLLAGEAINGASTSAFVFAGNDPSPGNILNGAPTYTATTLSQSVTAGVAGCIYTIVFVVTGTLSHNYIKVAQLSVIDPSAPF